MTDLQSLLCLLKAKIAQEGSSCTESGGTAQEPKSDSARDLEKLPAREMTDDELDAEGTRVGRLWDEMFEPDPETGEEFEGHGGSPGEWMVERLDEISTEQRRRLAKSDSGEGH